MTGNKYSSEGDSYYSSDYDSEDPCAGRSCDMGCCDICGGHTSGGSCLRARCDRDCCMEYEECCCDCKRCGGTTELYQWCYCGVNKDSCKLGTIVKLSYFQAMWRGYKYRQAVIA